MSAQLVEALRLLLAKVRRDAPELSGKLLGECEAALAAAEAQPVKEPPSDRQMLLDALESIERTALCTHWLGMNESRRRFAIARDARIAIERANGLRPSAPQPAPTAAQPLQELADETGWLIEMRVNGHTLWWGGEFDNNEVAWSRCRPWSTDSHRLIARLVSDAYKAVRFARREDAQKALDGLLTARPCPLLQNAPEVYSVQEHMWPASKVEAQSEQPVPLTDEQRAEVLDALPKADERETIVCCITGSTLRALARAHGIGSKS